MQVTDFEVVPKAGLEPARSFLQRILSRSCIHLFSTFSATYRGQECTKKTENDTRTAGKRWQLLLVILCPLTANAGMYFEGILTNYDRPDGSLWQQEFAGYPTKWGMNPIGYRIGIEHNGFSLSYANLGRYRIKAKASDNEDCVVATKSTRCDGAEYWYDTSGEIRAYIVSYKLVRKSWFVEYGIGAFRQNLKVDKEDVWHFNETLWGFGEMYGLGREFTDFDVGLYSYQSSIGSKFGASKGEVGSTPAGTNGAFTLTVRIKWR